MMQRIPLACMTACLTLALLLASLASSQSIDSAYPSRTTILALANKPRENATVVNHVRQHSQGRTVLGFIAPWNPRGTAVAEQFRGKFDVISPAWHTVNVAQHDGQAFYSVSGSSTGKADDEWQRRMQSATKDGNGASLKPVNISPRYVLDRFTAEDLLELLRSDDRMQAMATSVFNSVMDNNYDGAVFECGAVWAIEPLIKMMSELLHTQGKTLTVVLPAIQEDKQEQSIEMSKITVHAMRVLTPYVDNVVVMTYDYSGRSGVAYGDMYDATALPDGSPLDREGVRTPGPNTPLDFLQSNIEQLLSALQTDGSNTDQFVMSQQEGVVNDITGGAAVGSPEKLLAGLPLYGYTYAIGWFDNTAVSQNSVPRLPPIGPLVSKDNDTEAQAAARSKAEKRESETPNIVPLLRFAGEAFKHEELEAQMRASKALVRLDERSQEQFYDYVAELPMSIRERQEMLTKNGENPTDSGKHASYWRAYFPSAHTMRQRIKTIRDFDGVGIALWDLGQAGEWLLHEL